MKLVPYSAPRLAEFRSASFRRSTEFWWPRIDAALGAMPSVVYRPKGGWVFASGRHLLDGVAPCWRPKIYVCLRARDYWPGVARLLMPLTRDDVPWKFFYGPTDFDRPDKLVVYAASVREVRPLVRRLRRLVAGLHFHSLHHAATPAQMGLERAGARGLYLGLDPRFFPKGRMAWRWYRCAVSAWAGQNKAFLASQPGGAEGWFRRMNLSLEHEGPATLRPEAADIPFIQRTWKQMFSGGPRRSRR